ncbi:MAG: hypothetical protein Q4G14_06410 [Paracoccus sp. (in: a-proteobacteria)]|uniref:hypothetical protein n=1 Tax=Paracoccus sp. TaxID=267 RepID=UPI0026E0B5E6|nr:hypothetical protein [Paracoccus sp. (in: a-proteobacteria)]MDO5612862.1 hypothetical protein [Paracoccus sp. (in: a-proteobacteria)]
MSNRDNYTPGQEAHEVSHTRFGPRPPIGKAARGAHRLESRRIPPSGEVSPDGDREWPQPGLTSQVVVYGGAAIMAAAATAGVVLAARKVAGLISGPDETDRYHRPRVAPGFADLDDDEREAIRRRVREQARADAREVARMRAQASRDRFGPRPNAAQSLTQRADQVSGSLNGLMAAFAGFRSVAAQAGGIMREFSDAAQVVRSFLDRDGRDRNHDRDGTDPHRRDDAARRTHNL